MYSLSFTVAAGPCLILIAAAIALRVVNVGLSRLQHAMVWALGCVMGAIQWMILALGSAVAWPRMLTTSAGHVFSLLAMALLVEGFRLRRPGPGASRGAVAACGAGAILLSLVADLLPGLALRWAIFPLVSLGLTLWAARLVSTTPTPTRTEIAVVAVLLALGLIHLAALALASAAVLHHASYEAARAVTTGIYIATAGPITAARALAMLMIIAFDYASEFRRLLHTDPLTGVLNREGFDHAARAILVRRPRRLSLALADIDRFKQVNDLHGHAAGDASLTAFATHVARELGRDGIVARTGGEEFAILLPGLDGADARARIEALRGRLDMIRVPARADVRLAASFGVAERRSREGLEALIERADAALYVSKRAGRDRTTLATLQS